MALNILLSLPEKELSAKVEKLLKEENYLVDIANNGKDVQLKVYKNKYHSVFLDSHTENYSCFEVLKYIRVTSPFVKVILVFDSEKELKSFDLDDKALRKLGAQDVIFKPLSKDKLLKAINGEMQYKMWKKAQQERSTGEEQEISARDEEFTRIKLQDFYGGANTIFDIYIRINENRYLKILNTGETFDTQRIHNYKEKHKIEYLYFRTKDRAVYIHFVNSILQKTLEKEKNKPSENKVAKVKLVKNLVEKFVEEVYTQGLKPQLIEEGAQTCENISTIVQKDKGLLRVLKQFEDFDPSTYHHSFLVTFLSSIICSHLDWASEVTMQKIALGAMFHDIGKLKLHRSLALLRPKDMKPEQFNQYKLHPTFGIELLNSQSMITEPVKQIVFQHHECIDGSGFPRGITGIKIYPLAQIVGFANLFAHKMVDNKMPPVEALRNIFQDRELLAKFNPSILRALAEAFTEKDRIKEVNK